MRILVDYLHQEIRLTDERLAHILEHPEMRDMDRAIEDSLRNPGLVMRSQSDENVRLYYQCLPNTAVGEKWMCVVVKQGLEDPFITRPGESRPMLFRI